MGAPSKQVPFQLFPHILGDQLQPIRVHHIDLGRGHAPRWISKRDKDAQMLLRLGHDPLVRRYHQQGQVDAARPRQHVADEFLMARHVDDPALLPSGRSNKPNPVQW